MSYANSEVGLFITMSFYKVIAYKNLLREKLEYFDRKILTNKKITTDKISTHIKKKLSKKYRNKRQVVLRLAVLIYAGNRKNSFLDRS